MISLEINSLSRCIRSDCQVERWRFSEERRATKNDDVRSQAVRVVELQLNAGEWSAARFRSSRSFLDHVNLALPCGMVKQSSTSPFRSRRSALSRANTPRLRHVIDACSSQNVREIFRVPWWPLVMTRVIKSRTLHRPLTSRFAGSRVVSSTPTRGSRGTLA